jgi:MFS family permease
MTAVWRNGSFVRLWVAQVVLTLGGGLLQMGLLELFRAGGYAVRVETAKFSFAVALPGLVLGPVAMAWLDRWQRRMVLVSGDVVRATLAGAIAVWLATTGGVGAGPRNLWGVYGAMGLIGVIATFYLPARSALVPNLVETDRLLQANTVLATSLAMATVGGAALGGFVAERLGSAGAVTLAAASFLASATLVGTIRMAPHATRAQAATTAGAGWAEFVTGCRYLWRHPTALPLVVLNAFFAFLLGILLVVFVGYAMETLGLRTAGVGYLVVAGGAGAGLGIAALGRGRVWIQSPWVPVGQLGVAAAALVGLSATQQVGLAVPAVMVLGAVAATVLICIDARLQAQVEDVRRGAVFAARGMLTSAAMVVAFGLQFGTAWLRQTPAPTVLFWLGLSAAAAAVVMAAAARQGGRVS